MNDIIRLTIQINRKVRLTRRAMKNILKSFRANRLLYLSAAMVAGVLLIGGGLLYNNQRANESTGGVSKIPGPSKIDFSPGTSADQKIADAKKDTSAPANSSTNATAVTPIVSYVGQNGSRVIVNAFIPGIVETGGTCTFKANLGTNSLTPSPSVRTFIASSYTSCIQFSIPTSSFPKSGNWSFTITYSSVKHSGSSQVSSVEVN